MSKSNERMDYMGINKHMTAHETIKSIHKRKTNYQQRLS